MDAAILRTLAKIRNKDGVYSGENIIQTELAAAQAKAKKLGLPARTASRTATAKPFLLKDQHRVNVLEGVQSDSEDDNYDYYNEPVTVVEAERRARANALKAFGDFAGGDKDGSDDDSDDEFLAKREHGADEAAAEGEAYRNFLLEMGGGEEEVRRALGMADAEPTDFRESLSDEDDATVVVKEEKKSKKSKKTKEVSEEDKAAAKVARQKKRVQADEDFLME